MDLARLGLQVDSSSVRSATGDLSRFGHEGKVAAQSSGAVERSTSSMGAAFKGAAVQIAAAVGVMATVQKALGAAEQYTNMQNRLLALGASHESAAKQIQQLADIAQNTRAPLQATAELYSRLSLTADSLGASQQDLMQFTETVGLALAASGTSASEASGALTQLSQAMAGGVVRAEEFNSMIEGAPGLLMAVANGIEGVNGDLGALRQMMLDGELTSEQFFTALLSQNEALQASFEATSPTISQALTVMNDQFTLFIGSADQATGVTNTIAEAILMLAQNMDVAVPVFGAVAIGVAAITAPVLAAGVAIGALAIAVITHWDEIKQAFEDGVDYVVGLGSRLVQALKDAGIAAVNAAKQLGADIVAGIRSGITQKWEDLKSYVNGLGTGLIDGVKGIFEIRSPSRVMMQIGDDVVEGLIIGIDDNTARAVSHAESMGQKIGQGIKDGLDPVLRTVFDGLARGDLGSIGSGLLNMAQSGFSTLLQTSFSKGGGGLSNLWKSISGGFSNIGANYSSAGGGLAGIGSAISGLLPGIGAISSIVGVVQSLVGTTTKLTNALEGTLGIGGLLRGTEYDIKQKDNMFGSKTEKNSEEIFGSWAGLIAQDLDQEFRDMVQNTRDGIRALGLDINEAFTYDFDVQFDESLPHEQLMERLRQELNNANDELLRTSLAAAGLARDGETGAQTLGILNDSLRTANASLRLLDQALFDVSAIGAGAARELIEMSGGLDAFAGKTTFVFDNFLTETERTDRALQIATENMAAFEQQAGITLPATHAEFMALLDAQDLNTAAGRNLYTALLDVADEFVTVNGSALDAVPVLEDAAEAIEDVAGNSRAAADAARELAAQQREQESLLLQIARMTGNVDYIRRQELAALDAVNRPLQEHIYLLEDQAAAVEAQNAALQAALDTAQTGLATAQTDLTAAQDNLTTANGALADAYDDLDRVTQNRIDTLQDEIAGYQSVIDSARAALVALDAGFVEQTPLEEWQAATAAFETGLSDLASAISRERAAINATISDLESDLAGLESKADALRAALFPEDVEQDLIAAMQTRDVMSDMLSIAERLSGAARDVLRLNEDIVEQQRRAALVELQAMLNAGRIDPDSVDRLTRDASAFSSKEFGTFEEMAFEQKRTFNVLEDLSDLQEDLAKAAQREEDARAADARVTALAQLATLEAQAADIGTQIEVEREALAALDLLESDFGLVESYLSAADIAQNLPKLQADARTAKDAAILHYSKVIADNDAMITAAGDQITELEGIREEYGLIDDAILTVEAAITNLVGAQAGVTSAIQAVADAAAAVGTAQGVVDDAQDAVDNAGGSAPTAGGGGTGGGFGLSSAEKRLMGILEGISGASGAALLEGAAFGAFSADNMNAILSDVGVAALSGSAAAAAQAFEDALGRNIDVAGLGFYTGVIDAQTAALGDLDAAMEFVRRDVSANGDQFEYAIQQMASRLAAPIDADFYGQNLGHLATIGAGVFTLGSQMEAMAGAAFDAISAAQRTPVASINVGQSLIRRNTGFGVPSYANGTDNHPGGMARLHENEMVNLPRGTSVSTAGEVREMVELNRKLVQQNEQNAAEMRQMRRLLTDLADIESDRRAEELNA